MKKITSLLIFLVTVYAVQSQNRVVTTGVPFLLITADAKSAGIGEQGVATSPDAFSQNWNPSKYAFAPNDSGLGISYTPYLSQLVNDIFLGNITFYKTTSDRSAWSASLKYFSLGEIEIGQTPDDFINPLIDQSFFNQTQFSFF